MVNDRSPARTGNRPPQGNRPMKKRPYNNGPRPQHNNSPFGPHNGPQLNGGGYRQNGPPRPRYDGPRPSEPPAPVEVGPDVPRFEGALEIHNKGYGFLRQSSRNYIVHPSDPYVPIQFIQRHGLREGTLVSGAVEIPRNGQGPRLLNVELIEGEPAADFKPRNFDELTPVDPHELIRLETGAEPLTTRVMDLLTPIGKGQRGLLVAPPRSGKTVMLQHIAAAVAENHPEMYLIVLLVDERPEEVTDIKRSVKGEVVASSSDRDTITHVRTAEMVMNRAKRLTEQGKQVFVLLDSLTRLARAYNKHCNTGRTMSGGMDVRALDVPKKMFGAARAFEEGGSLTIMGTALIETGSRMDDLIFQEFKGTGNMELVLDRKLSDRRVYPALDISQSGTRKEERLMDPISLQRVHMLRRTLVQMKPTEAMEQLVKQMGKSKSNAEFLDKIAVTVR